MKISGFCIERPVFTLMLIAALVVFGLTAYRNLGVSLFPDVDFPGNGVFFRFSCGYLPGESCHPFHSLALLLTVKFFLLSSFYFPCDFQNLLRLTGNSVIRIYEFEQEFQTWATVQ